MLKQAASFDTVELRVKKCERKDKKTRTSFKVKSFIRNIIKKIMNMQTKNLRISTYYFDTFGKPTECGSKIANKLSIFVTEWLNSNVFKGKSFQHMTF